MNKILIIHDDASVREPLAEELAADGHLVVPISEPSLAGQVIGTLRPDLLLLKLQMDGKDRWDVLNEVKTHDPNLRVLVLGTYAADQEDTCRSFTNVYVMKSFLFAQLREKVAEVLGLKPIHDEGIIRGKSLQPAGNKLNRLRPFL
jgi:two-component system OmpR family response regulator